MEERQEQLTDVDNFPLDDATIRLLDEYRQQVMLMNAQQQGALVHFIRQHGLQGEWRVAQSGRELEKVSQQGR